MARTTTGSKMTRLTTCSEIVRWFEWLRGGYGLGDGEVGDGLGDGEVAQAVVRWLRA